MLGDIGADVSVLSCPWWRPSSTSAEHRDACSYAGVNRVSGSRSFVRHAAAATTNVDTETFLYLPNTSLSGAAHQSAMTCWPAESNSFPPTPMRPPCSHPTSPFLTPHQQSWAAGAEQGRIIAISSWWHSAKFIIITSNLDSEGKQKGNIFLVGWGACENQTADNLSKRDIQLFYL